MIFLLCGFAINSKAEVKAEASETIELTSILSRLAGYNEYVSNEGGSYISDVDSWFGKYKAHNAVSNFTQLRNQYGIMYDNCQPRRSSDNRQRNAEEASRYQLP